MDKPFFPEDRSYDKDHHLWIKAENDAGCYRIGSDALGIESIGDLAFLVLPSPGSHLQRGQVMGTLEAAKMTGDLVAPLSGIVRSRNENALQDPATVYKDPYEDGWLIVVEASHWEEESVDLLQGNDVAPWVDAESERYRIQGWLA